MSNQQHKIAANMVSHFVFDRIGSVQLPTTKYKHTHNLSQFTDYTGKDVIFFFPVSSAFPQTRIYFDCIDKCACVCVVIVFETNLHKIWKIDFDYVGTIDQDAGVLHSIFFINSNRMKLIEKKRIKVYAWTIIWIFSKNSLWGFEFQACISIEIILLSKYFQNKIHRGKFSFLNTILLFLYWKFLISVKFALNINII